MEEFVFPEQGGVTGTRAIECPYCSAVLELEVDVGNRADAHKCGGCGGVFTVDWVDDTLLGG